MDDGGRNANGGAGRAVGKGAGGRGVADSEEAIVSKTGESLGVISVLGEAAILSMMLILA